MNQSNKMKPEIKQRWVTALRSGTYEQGYGFLNKDNRYCCLGVLCDIIKNEIELDTEVNNSLMVYDGCTAILPMRVANYCGVDTGTHIKYNSKTCDFPELNDGLRLTFNEIADIIEEQL